MRQGEIIGKNVKQLREKRGMSINELARRVGVRLNTVQSIEKGATQKSKWLPDIARILGAALSDIDPSQSLNTANPTTVLPRQIVVGDKDLSVFATTEAGDGALVMSSDPVDKVDRPPSLAYVRDAYGVIVTGESMIPVLRPGDIVVVHPHRQPRREDICVFRVELHGEFRSRIKEFVSRVDNGWRVKEYGPKEREFTISKDDWPECHVVVTIHRR